MSKASRVINSLFTLESERPEVSQYSIGKVDQPVHPDIEDRLRALERGYRPSRSHGFIKTVGTLGVGAAVGVGGILAYGMLNKTTVDVEELDRVAEAFATGEAHIGTIGTDMRLAVHVNRKTPIIDIKPDYDATLGAYTEVDLAFPTIVNGAILDIQKTTTHKRGKKDEVDISVRADASLLVLRGNRVSFAKSNPNPYEVKDSNVAKTINWLALKDRSGLHTRLEAAALEYAERAAADPVCVQKALAQIAINDGYPSDARPIDQVNAGIKKLLKDSITNSVLHDQGSLIDPASIHIDIVGSWKADGINGQLSGVLKRHGLKSGAIQRGNERCDTAHIVYSDGHSVGPAIPSSETKTVAK